MKKWVKTCLIAGVSCTVAGAVLVCIGSFSGGKNYVRTADLNHFSASATHDKDSSVLKKTQIEDYHNLDINLDMLDLNVVCSNDKHFYISYEAQSQNQKSAVTYSVENDTLTLKETTATKGSYIHIDVDFLADLLSNGKEPQSKNVVTLYVPENTNINDLKLHSDMSNVSLSSLAVSSGSIQTSSGDITVDDCTISQVNLSSDMGDVTIDDSELNTCHFSSNSGDFVFTGTTLKGNTEITSDMGEINITGPAEILTKLAIQVTTDMGDIDVSGQLNGKVMNNESDSVRTFEQKVEKATDSLAIETDSGDITLECK